MKITLTNLSNNLFEDSRLLLNQSALKNGISEVNSYDFDEITNTDFFYSNKQILKQSRGLGYWLWKPYIILETMKSLSENDIVIYSDCGIEILQSLDPLIKICSDLEPIVLFGNGDFANIKWTKRDCFILMNCDYEHYWYGPHCDAAFSLFRKTDISIKFLNEWLLYGSDERIITDSINTCGFENLPGFIEHRWDQSILSLLAQKYRLDLYRMPTQFGNHYKKQAVQLRDEFNCLNQSDQQQLDFYSVIPYHNSPYFQLLNHHRAKKVNGDVSIEKINESIKIKQSFFQLLKWILIKSIKRILRILEN